MFHQPTPVFDRLPAQIADLSVIDCYEHADAGLFGPAGYERLPAPAEPLAALTNGYVLSDFCSAGASLAERLFNNPNKFFKMGLLADNS